MRNKTLDDLSLRDFEFYSEKIGMSKEIYDIINDLYKKFGQFNYFELRETKHIEEEKYITKDNKRCVSVIAVIYGEIDTFREIIVYDNGLIREAEYDSQSSLMR